MDILESFYGKLLIILVIASFAFGIIFLSYNNENTYTQLPTVQSENIVVEAGFGNVKDVATSTDNLEKKSNNKTISVTNNMRHSVPLEEIRGGGPPKDGIPSIDDPVFDKVSVSKLDDSEPGIALSIGNVNKFYPFRILVWHEIVNDMIDNQRVLVTYCPLCLSGIVFDPLVNEERVEFGTSGKLWQSNLVMYDRKTDTYWSQILGEAIAGELTGAKLKVLQSDQMRFGEWKSAHPDGMVLSEDTGKNRIYGFDPYGDYYTNNDQLIGTVTTEDNRLKRKDIVLGVVIDDEAKAYSIEKIKKVGSVKDTVGNIDLLIKYEINLDVVRIYTIDKTGKKTIYNPIYTFWFSWVAAHPTTKIY